MHQITLWRLQYHNHDMINHDKLDNRLSNLRLCTRSQNNANMRPRVGYKGVRFTRNGWQAETKIDGKYIYIGRYKTAEEAAIAYNQKTSELFGEFAFNNIIPQTGVA